ncbi:MAG: RHS repeat protein [Ferruginibacter sp.]
MIKPLIATFVLCAVLCKISPAQYYHKDILSTKQAAAERKLLQGKQIRTIKVHSFEPDGTASEGFFCERKFKKDYSEMETVTEASSNSKSVLISVYNGKGQLVSTTDSSELAVNRAVYVYDVAGNITSITSVSFSSDDDFHVQLTEVHRYSYNERNIPFKMVKVKNNTDSVQVDFIIDEKGNVTDEIEPGAKGRHYYYYYDAANRLSDIVRFNVVKKKLLADFSFEYDEDGSLVQMVTVDDGADSNYYTWKYIYNEGLKIIEKCFSKEKQLLGYVEYEYD